MISSQHQFAAARQIYELRYTAYVGNKSIDPNPDGVFTDKYDDAENCLSHIEYIDGRPAGSIRACVYDPSRPDLPIPAMTDFHDEIGRNIGYDKVFVEANRFAIHPEFQHQSRRLKFRLLRFVFDHALAVNAEYLIGAPRPSQASFYHHMFFEPISSVKRYKSVNFETILLACPLESARRQVRDNDRYRNLQKIGFI